MARGNGINLTDAMIRKLPRAKLGKRNLHYDRLCPGLFLEVNDNGRMAWKKSFRFGGGRPKVTFGHYPAVGVARAREMAAEATDLAKSGINPSTVMQRNEPAEKTPRPFGPLCEDYLKRKIPELARGAEVESRIQRRILPFWKDKPIDELRKRDAITLTDKVIDEGKPAEAFAVYETIKAVFSWLMDRDEIDANPMSSLKPPVTKKPRDRVLNDDELKAVWLAAGETSYPFGDLTRLITLTGVRRSEAAQARWREIDLDKAVWIIPSERAKMNRPQLVPLSTQAVALLQAPPRYASDDPEADFVFSTTSGKRPISGFSKMKARLDRKCGVVDWRLHDLRRTVRSELPKLGVAEVVCERVIGHVARGIEKTYNVYQYKKEKAEAVQLWADHIDTLAPPSNVVDLQRAAG